MDALQAEVMSEPTTRRGEHCVLLGLLIVAAFVVSHNLSPLYTSNQNTKFVIGMARAHAGALSEDYLAHTTDPFPLFTEIVYFTQAHLTPAMYYLYAAVLMGLYVYGMFGIARHVLPRFDQAARWAFAALLILAHAVILRIPIRDATGRDIMGLVQDGWASQYILGPIFQPSMFGVLLLCAMRWFLEKRWLPCVLGIAIAAAMHPSYVLISVMLTIALTVSLLLQRRWGVAAFVLIASLAMILPLAIHLKHAFAPTTPQTYQAAQKILAEERIPHHMVIQRFFKGMAVTQVVWVLAAIVLARRSRLMLPLAIVFGLAMALTLIAGVGSGMVSTHVREIQPWRATAWAIPVSTAVVLASVAYGLSRIAAGRTWLTYASIVTIAICAAGGAAMQVWQFRLEKQQPDWGLMEYVHATHKPGELYVVPVHANDLTASMEFRLHTEAATYATFKSHPNKDIELLQWWDRYGKAQDFYDAKGPAARDAALNVLLAEHPTHIVTPTDEPLDRPGIERVWGDANYTLYHIK